MLTIGPYAQLGLIVAGLWIFVIGLAVLCIIAGAAGQRSARRRGRQCPECDYRGDSIDMLIHRVLEHERSGLCASTSFITAGSGGG